MAKNGGSQDLKIAIDEADAAIRGRRFEVASTLLAEHQRELKRHRPLWGRYAQLLRRMGRAEEACGLLRPLLLGQSRRKGSESPLNDEELSELGVALVQAGALKDGMDVLMRADPQRYPQNYLYQAFGLFAQWDYPSAEPLLLTYADSPKLTDYERCVCFVNLAATAANLGKYTRTLELVDQARRRFDGPEFEFLRLNLRELELQASCLGGERLRNRAALADAGELHDKAGDSLFGHLLRKWVILSRHLQNEVKTDTTLDALEKLSADACRRGFWEVARDCDLQSLRLRPDDAVMSRLYFGTPFPAYRTRVRALADASGVAIASRFRWRPGPRATGELFGASGRSAKVFALREHWRATGASGSDPLRGGGLPLRLLLALRGDFYAPLSFARLHELLQPESFFNFESSVRSLQFHLHRARSALADSPLRVVQARGFLHLELDAGHCFEIERVEETEGSGPRRVPKAQDLLFRRIEETMGSRLDGGFAIHDLAPYVDKPRRTLQRLLQSLCTEGRLTLEGSGRGQKYRKAS